jgi:omega-amidase
MTTLRVTLIQTALIWHDPEANRRKFDLLMAPLAGKTDVIVLPEMFTTGFTMDATRMAEPANGATVEWLRSAAARLDAAITGSVVTEDGGRYFNRLTWMPPEGRSSSYDKRHLFRMAREHEHYASGDTRPTVTFRSFRICPLVCYDLRFPVWSRNRLGRDEGYDVLIYVANWPERRRYAWQTLLRARAIENLSYCVGVNRVGPDGGGIDHTGDSVALDFLGQPLAPVLEGESVVTVTLERAALETFRAKFPAHLDADEFELE